MERKVSNINICMIGGSGRSGTTILKQVFSKHPEVAAVPEYRFPIDPDGLIDYFLSVDCGWSPYHADTRLKRLESMLRSVGSHNRLARAFVFLSNRYGLEKYFSRCLAPRYAGIALERQCPTFSAHVTQLIRTLEGFRYTGQWNGSEMFSPRLMHYSPRGNKEEVGRALGGFWRDVIHDVCRNQNKSTLVEDNTWCILWFDTILELLPDARMVHVVRDPRDVVTSYTKMRWAPDDPLQAALWYKGIINEWFRVRERVGDQQYIEIRLEDLVDRPKDVLERICRFWDLPWNDALLTVDLGRSNSGRWRSELTRADGEMVTRLLGEELERLGYPA